MRVRIFSHLSPTVTPCLAEGISQTKPTDWLKEVPALNTKVVGRSQVQFEFCLVLVLPAPATSQLFPRRVWLLVVTQGTLVLKQSAVSKGSRCLERWPDGPVVQSITALPADSGLVTCTCVSHGSQLQLLGIQLFCRNLHTCGIPSHIHLKNTHTHTHKALKTSSHLISWNDGMNASLPTFPIPSALLLEVGFYFMIFPGLRGNSAPFFTDL